MGRNILTSNIIYNCLNFETLFEPIIYFIEIDKPLYIPPQQLYMVVYLRTT
jgi:hypothetical protein